MIVVALLAAFAVVVVPVAGTAEGASASATENQYDAAFDKSFPVVAGAHRIADWKFYAAIVGGDIVGYTIKVDPAFAARLAQMKGKGYQIQQLEDDIKKDKGLRAAFDDHRHRLASMTVTTDGNATDGEPCPHPLLYVGNEFRLVLGEIPWNENPLAGSTVAPTCPQMPERGFQITAGRSSRFKCWTAQDITRCGWRLQDMPADLKRVIENEYPRTIKVRWTWRGLGRVSRFRQLDLSGNRVAERDSLALTVPGSLALEFVDDKGQIRWTAAAGVGSTSVAEREKR